MHFASSMIDSTGCLLVWRHWKEIDAVKAQSTDQIMLTWTMISGAILFFSPRRSKATSPNRAKTNFEGISTGTLWISFPNSRPKALMSLMERVSDKNHKTTNKGFLKFHIPRVISGRLGKGPPKCPYISTFAPMPETVSSNCRPATIRMQLKSENSMPLPFKNGTRKW